MSLRYLTLRRSGFKRTYSSDLRFQKSIQYLSVENSWPQEIITSPLRQFDLSSVFKIFPYSVWNALVKNSECSWLWFCPISPFTAPDWCMRQIKCLLPRSIAVYTCRAGFVCTSCFCCNDAIFPCWDLITWVKKWFVNNVGWQKLLFLNLYLIWSNILVTISTPLYEILILICAGITLDGITPACCFFLTEIKSN